MSLHFDDGSLEETSGSSFFQDRLKQLAKSFDISLVDTLHFPSLLSRFLQALGNAPCRIIPGKFLQSDDLFSTLEAIWKDPLDICQGGDRFSFALIFGRLYEAKGNYLRSAELYTELLQRKDVPHMDRIFALNNRAWSLLCGQVPALDPNIFRMAEREFREAGRDADAENARANFQRTCLEYRSPQSAMVQKLCSFLTGPQNSPDTFDSPYLTLKKKMLRARAFEILGDSESAQKTAQDAAIKWCAEGGFLTPLDKALLEKGVA